MSLGSPLSHSAHLLLFYLPFCTEKEEEPYVYGVSLTFFIDLVMGMYSKGPEIRTIK